ncbi:AbrB/MazE/SpoVT family DNA-binding domain-containing protein [Thermofilum pendens]|uniref:Transcriptional regulator, AbrB family n=1 Tax=Thermofilum pendens (strain DSM 2475 / Hrk 5) TaxID=368408 RepID=A1S0M5_THEPD|nr:AbrB/MazE/SpoVT family DNA-binding domain-containing protein [Thermofilum pendens]ABL79005.1 transcriptional regulator, AbrB family [Thermofilum pendens Hrk 5]
MSESVRVGKRFTVVIPKSVREKVGLKEGDLLEVRVEGGRIVLERKDFNPFKVLAEVIGEPYREERDERKAEEWLRNACR